MKWILTALLAAGLPLSCIAQVSPAANVQVNLSTGALQTTDGPLTSISGLNKITPASGPFTLGGSLYSTAGILTNNASGNLVSLSNVSAVNATLMGILGTGWSNSTSLFLTAAGTWAAGSGGGGSPGGSPGQLQWNSSSSFAGTAGLTWSAPTLATSQTSNTVLSLFTAANTNTGTGAAASVAVNNATNGTNLVTTGTGYTGTLLTSGPTGQGGFLYTSGSIPLTLGTNGTAVEELFTNGAAEFFGAVEIQGAATLQSSLTVTNNATLGGTVDINNFNTAGIVINNSSGDLISTSNASSVNSTLMGLLGSGWTNSSSYVLTGAGTWASLGGAGVTSLTGTSGQITASASTGAVTLSIPTAMTGIDSLTAAASSGLTLSSGTGNTNLNLNAAGSGLIVANAGFSQTVTANTFNYVGQDSTHQLVFGWTYNATAANAYAIITTIEENNLIDFQAKSYQWDLPSLTGQVQLFTNGDFLVGGGGDQGTPFGVVGNSTFTGTISTDGGAQFAVTAINTVSPTSPNRTFTLRYNGTNYYIAGKTTDD